MRVFRFLLPAALAAFLVLFAPCRADFGGGGALADAAPAPSQADAPEDGEDEEDAERLAACALRLMLLPVRAIARAFTACEEEQGEAASGWIREGAELLRALLDELRELLPAGSEACGGSSPESDVSLIWPSPVGKPCLV